MHVTSCSCSRTTNLDGKEQCPAQCQQTGDGGETKEEVSSNVIDLIETKPSVTPNGQYAVGLKGPFSILVPCGHGFKDEEDLSFLNALTTMSGSVGFVVASNALVGEDQHSHAVKAQESRVLMEQLYVTSGISTVNANMGTIPFVSSIVEASCYGALKSVGMGYCNTMSDCVKMTPQGPDLKLNGK